MPYSAAVQNNATLSQVIGSSLKRIRDARGWTQEELAKWARITGGLRWSQSTVAVAEAGDRSFSFEEVLALSVVLAEPVDELLKGGDRIDDATVVEIGAWSPSVETIRKLVRSVEGVLDLEWRSGTTGGLVLERVGQAERKAARKLGCSVEATAAAAARLWGESLGNRRDRLVRERLGGPEQIVTAPLRTVQALRGHVTRELLEELAAELKED